MQRIPALLNEVHDLIEARGLVFVLTGSSARTLRRRGVNLLAGRALTYRMHPLTAVEDLLIAVRLPVFARKAKRKLTSQKKFYFFDAGVFRAIRPVGPLDSDAEMEGPALETLVLQELRAVNDYYDYGYQISFWRTRSSLEVDFVLYGPRGLLAIEIKRSTQIQPKDTRALREFKKDYPPAKCFVFYGGPSPLYMDDVTVLPVEHALRNLHHILGNGE